jgi:hypothetical protein
MRGMVWKAIVDNRVRTNMDRPHPDYYQVSSFTAIVELSGTVSALMRLRHREGKSMQLGHI